MTRLVMPQQDLTLAPLISQAGSQPAVRRLPAASSASIPESQSVVGFIALRRDVSKRQGAPLEPQVKSHDRLLLAAAPPPPSRLCFWHALHALTVCAKQKSANKSVVALHQERRLLGSSRGSARARGLQSQAACRQRLVAALDNEANEKKLL